MTSHQTTEQLAAAERAAFAARLAPVLTEQRTPAELLAELDSIASDITGVQAALPGPAAKLRDALRQFLAAPAA